MNNTSVFHSEFEFFKDHLLGITDERTLKDLLKRIVTSLGKRDHVALARIWMKYPGDICDSCHFADECPTHVECLHLVASEGTPQAALDEDWNRLNGSFRRFPMGVRKVGRISASGELMEIIDIEKDSQWIARPDWAKKENIRGFIGQSISYKGDRLGVVAIFMRIPVPKEAGFWLRIMSDHIAAAIANAQAFEEIEKLRSQLELENAYLKEEVLEAQSFGEIVGKSPPLQAILHKIEVVAPTDAGVLILGESGTGKELVAREIHKRSQRSDGPMIRVNCASIPKELYGSEFFGHTKGAFTGAFRDREGRFAAADGGTLFLDEIGEIPLDLQSKLLRVLQEGTYEKVGEDRTRKANVRIVAATNQSLEKEVQKGRFRKDLYYRLNIFPIEVPSLLERIEDIPLLAIHFLRHCSKKLNLKTARLTKPHIVQLQNYDWPGNIRELQNVIERALITAKNGKIHFDLPETLSESGPRSDINLSTSSENEVFPEFEMRRREKENTRNALEEAGWKIYGEGGAAELLGIKPTTLISRMKKMGIKRRN